MASSAVPSTLPIKAARSRAFYLWEKLALWALAAAFVYQAGSVWLRATHPERPFTDLSVFTTAGWAIRTGADPYEIADANDWHYVYPPVFAMLMTPFATAPAGAAAVPAVPFAVTVIVWYGLSVLFLVLAVHWLASTLETASGTRPSDARDPVRWCTLRALPVVVCLPPIFGTLAHGQVNFLLLLLLCGMAASLLHGRQKTAGLCLSGAICLKVFPAFLLGYVVWRGHWRCLASCMVGLLLGLFVVPACVVGPERAMRYNRTFADVVLLPAVGLGSDTSRDDELTGIAHTDSQSLVAVFHNTLHPRREGRPLTVSTPVRMCAMICGLVLTGVTVLAAGRRRLAANREVLFLGALIVNMLVLCPVAHLHYFCLLLPVVMALVHYLWLPAQTAVDAGRGTRRDRRLLRGLTVLFLANALLRIVSHVPGVFLFRDLGTALHVTLAVWLVAVVSLRRDAAGSTVSVPAASPRVAA